MKRSPERHLFRVASIAYAIGISFAVIFLFGQMVRADESASPMIPSADEMPVVGDGDAETDALLDCYEKFRGPEDKSGETGPPHIVRNSKRGVVLRADFGRRGEAAGNFRLLCFAQGFQTSKEIDGPPLDPASVSQPDANTQRLIDGWHARKKAMADRIASTPRYASFDAATIRKLEGIWLIGTVPDHGPCLSHWYMHPQIEFEFRKSGGRALVFESPDLFTPVVLSGAKADGDMLALQTSVAGGFSDFLHIRWLAPDRFEIAASAGSAAQLAYKCGELDTTVNAAVGAERLSALTQSFPSVIDGVSDSDRCAGAKLTREQYKQSISIQIEALGPIHYWVLAWGFWDWPHKLTYAFIRSITDKGNGVLALDMQEHLEKGDGWDGVESHGQHFELTVIDRGSRIEIPELKTTFVRCKPGAPGSVGMHRF